MTRALPDSVSIEQLTKGFTCSDGSLNCLFCGENRKMGHIYPLGEGFVEAELAMRNHIESAHQSAFHGLLALGKKGTGLSDIQRTLLGYFFEGLPDKEIQPLVGDVSMSTIRNHRFAMREKARQAKVFLAVMDLLESSHQDPGSRLIEIPGSRSSADERFAITQAEFKKIIKGQFPEGPDGAMSRFPKKQKRKIAVLVHILKRFDPTRRYTQAEVNEILETVHEDYTTLCRYLVDYGFLGRTRDGAEYWVE